ncbi:butyrate kinase [Marinilabiliaceae bacterium ANBcel2]|nr:butyrate kinase [Marinilabiliaceae bacterium ANBcel2]
MYKILVINPGSTSTKIAVYDDETPLIEKTLRHDSDIMDSFNSITDQYEFRKDVILKELNKEGINVKDLDAVVGRGGMVYPIESGVYEVNDLLKRDLKNAVMGEHASNLGGLIADDIASSVGDIKAYIADPVVVDELQDVARITGHPLLPRQSKFHALNQKAVARRYAKNSGVKYEDINLIVAHMGGGISVGAHYHGRIIDVNNALDGFGPFSPERAGTVPAGKLVDLCFNGDYSKEEIKLMITGKGGLVAHLGTNQAHVATERAEKGDEKADLIIRAMAYQVAKAIGSASVVLKGEYNQIILTGGMANNPVVLRHIKEYIDFMGKLTIYPGEDEMEALSLNVLSVLRNEMESKEYNPKMINSASV